MKTIWEMKGITKEEYLKLEKTEFEKFKLSYSQGNSDTLKPPKLYPQREIADIVSEIYRKLPDEEARMEFLEAGKNSFQDLPPEKQVTEEENKLKAWRNNTRFLSVFNLYPQFEKDSYSLIQKRFLDETEIGLTLCNNISKQFITDYFDSIKGSLSKNSWTEIGNLFNEKPKKLNASAKRSKGKKSKSFDEWEKYLKNIPCNPSKV